MLQNEDQNNSEYGRFLHSDGYFLYPMKKSENL